MVYLLLGEGFEEGEALVALDMLRRGGVETEMVSLGGATVTSSHGVTVTADRLLADAKDDAEMIILPGGLGGVANILANERALELIRGAHERGAYVAAICAAPTVLAKLGILGNRAAVCYPGMENEMGDADMKLQHPVVVDGHFITGECAGASFDFGLKLVEVLKGAEAAEKVKAAIHYRH